MSNKWFFGNMSAEDAEGLLKSDGEFLIRKSINSGLYTLSLFSSCLTPPIRHFVFTKHSSGQLSLSGACKYDNLRDFVEFHEKSKGSLPTLLKSYPLEGPTCLKPVAIVKDSAENGAAAATELPLDPRLNASDGKMPGSRNLGTIFNAFMCSGKDIAANVGDEVTGSKDEFLKDAELIS